MIGVEAMIDDAGFTQRCGVAQVKQRCLYLAVKGFMIY